MLLISPAFAENNSTNITSAEAYEHIIPLPEEFYGTVTYSDGSLIPHGTEILTLNQRGKIIGKFTLMVDGKYGDSYQSTPRLVVNGEYTDDILTFYVGEIRVLQTTAFDSGTINKRDLIIPVSAKPAPTEDPTPIPTTEIPTIISTTPIAEPTINGTLVNNIPTQIPTRIPTQPPVEDATPKFLGVLCIAIGICVIGAILTYFILTKKMKREDEEEIIL